MKRYRIVYFLKPDYDNIEIIICAKSYEEACIFAKTYRPNSFSIEELNIEGEGK